MKNWLAFIGVIVSFGVAATEVETADEGDTYQAVLHEFSDGLSTLAGGFRQESYDDRGGLQEAAGGQFYLAAPNLFRWDYEEPYAQHIVADGLQVWVYDVDLEQVTVRPQDEAEDETPLSLLTRPKALENRFEVTLLDTATPPVLRLVPRDSESQLAYVEAEIDGKALVSMQIVDVFDQRTRLVFMDVKRNESVEPARFKFAPPEGIDVVGNVMLTPDLFSGESQQSEPDPGQ